MLGRTVSLDTTDQATAGPGHRDGLDLDQLPGVPEHRHAERGAGCVVLTERRSYDVPRRHQIGPVGRGDVHGRLEDVGSRRSRRQEGLDLVVEGSAVQVRDDARLRTLADLWRSKYHGDWDFTVEDGTFHHADGGSALVFEVVPTKVLAFAKGRFAQTRYRFPVEDQGGVTHRGVRVGPTPGSATHRADPARPGVTSRARRAGAAAGSPPR